MQLAQSLPACTRATCINVVGSYLWLELQQLSYYTLLISSQFNSVFFVLFCNCIPALLYFRIPPRGSSLQVTYCLCLTYLLPPLAMWDVVSFFSLPPSSRMSESPAVSIARVLLLPSVGTWSLVHHGFCTLWTVFKTYCVTCFLLALVAPFSRGCVSALLGEYVPSFPQGVF